MANDTELSSYLQYLPAIFSEDGFLGRFLLPFERVLTGATEAAGADKRFLDEMGLEEIIERIPALFDPQRISSLFRDETEADRGKFEADRKRLEEFLTWLAGWVALKLRADWTLEQQRRFLADIVPLYRTRGVRENLIKLLRIYTGLSPVITTASDTDFQIGVNSTVGVDAQIGGGSPHFFHVRVTMPNPDPETLQRQYQVATALIELQKPAHTRYKLDIVFNTMQIGARSTIGVDTLLGVLTLPNTEESN